MFNSAETAFGGVDVLINNAGIMNLATIANSSDALWDRHIAVNLKTWRVYRGQHPTGEFTEFRIVLPRAGASLIASR